jgi:hypothetical protein
LERGEIDLDQAAKRLAETASARQRDRTHSFPKREPSQAEFEVIPGEPEDPASFWRWWMVPVGIGALLAVVAGLWMASDLRDGSLGLGFLCAWFPMIVGIGLLLLGAFNRRGPWANVRVRSQKADGHVDFKMNLPISIDLASKTLRFVGDRVPRLDREDVDNLVDALEEAGNSGTPIHIQANSGDGEDSVDISIS